MGGGGDGVLLARHYPSIITSNDKPTQLAIGNQSTLGRRYCQFYIVSDCSVDIISHYLRGGNTARISYYNLYSILILNSQAPK